MEFFGLSLIMMLPAGGVILLIIIFYLIYNRINDRKKEDFEKRSN